MTIRMKKVIFWIIAFILTLSIAIYQRMTGPTYPKSYEFSLNDQAIQISLPRSQNGTSDAMIRLNIDNVGITGRIFYRRFKTADPMDTITFHRENSELVAWLPGQPAAGKLEYGMILFDSGGNPVFHTPENIIIRFKAEVPPLILIPHVILIFTAMLLSSLTGLYAIARIPSYKLYTFLTLLFFLLGGMIMGPVVQKFAFGEYWTGFPFGKDLTDNKALIAFVFWIVAWSGNLKGKERRYLVILAAIVNLVIAIIPHSLMGSELDYSSGEIKTGMILSNWW